eukprot:TRINITY_DN2849_c1_g1_i1.p1 TRINITY_DN2849_c1_g1~~TRINITY_DN2849_c1_g1_i1.p1  ORF type:complete len:891 (-),score=264.62 TRINITY_DN2849_c1_g1_i1:87-2759(-)
MLSNRPPQRFSLLLLDEDEYYFDDFSAYYYLPNLDDETAFKRRVKGRLKLCSASIIFDPEEIKLPILKIPFRHVDFVDKWQPNLMSKLPAKADLFVIRSNMVLEMKENNTNAPYVFKEGRADHKFSLTYVALSSFLPRLNQLVTITKLPPESRESQVNIIIEERENGITFNKSALEDINEKILTETKCIRVTPLVNDPGRILITNAIVYFQPFNNISAHPVDKIRLDSIVRMQKRRYVLRDTGIEIFMEGDKSMFFAFQKPSLRDEVFDTLIKQPAVLKSQAMDDQHNMTLKWQNGLISNYDYLMFLNYSAGRTFNDLTQYPVFPWIIADYSSPVLDLTNEKTFRDLSKPIGALNQERLKMLQERMEEMPDPKFLYGTHYSTPGYVLFYLLRQAPEYMLRLQNGKFDAPSRMFHSIQETWTGVNVNQADVKELIPEFYQENSAEFLLNSERLPLGVKPETGVRLDDVVLPQWAKDPHDFVVKCREALESDFISEHLNDWIDLIFGYKQQGEEAKNANNVFYHLTYEGAVNIDMIRDPLEKAAIISQIKEFGQTPKRLFTEPHPKRLPMEQRVKDVPSVLTPDSSEPLDLGTRSVHSWEHIHELDLKFSFRLHKDLISEFQLSRDNQTLYSVSQDASLKIYSLAEKKQIRSVNLCESLALSSCQLSPDEKVVIAGSWDNNIYAYSIESGRTIETVAAHDDSVSCLCLKNDLLASGSWDSTVKTWQVRPSGIHRVQLAEFMDHDAEVHCIDLAKQGSICVTGAADGTVMLLDVRNKLMIRQSQPHDDIVNCVKFTPDGGRIVTGSNDGSLKILEVGGSEIFNLNLGTPIRALQTNGDHVIVGGDDGVLRVFNMKSGVESGNWKGNDPIHAIICSDDGENLILGSQGTIRLFR